MTNHWSCYSYCSKQYIQCLLAWLLQPSDWKRALSSSLNWNWLLDISLGIACILMHGTCNAFVYKGSICHLLGVNISLLLLKLRSCGEKKIGLQSVCDILKVYHATIAKLFIGLKITPDQVNNFQQGAFCLARFLTFLKKKRCQIMLWCHKPKWIYCSSWWAEQWVQFSLWHCDIVLHYCWENIKTSCDLGALFHRTDVNLRSLCFVLGN